MYYIYCLSLSFGKEYLKDTFGDADVFTFTEAKHQCKVMNSGMNSGDFRFERIV